MSEEFDAGQTGTELDILADQLTCKQEGLCIDSSGNDIKMSTEEIESAMQKLLRDIDDDAYPKITDKDIAHLEE